MKAKRIITAICCCAMLTLGSMSTAGTVEAAKKKECAHDGRRYGVVTDQPGCYFKGKEEIRCVKCNKTISTKTLPKLEHHWVLRGKAPFKFLECDKCYTTKWIY